MLDKYDNTSYNDNMNICYNTDVICFDRNVLLGKVYAILVYANVLLR